MELTCNRRRTNSRAVLIAALLSFSVSAHGQISPCDLNGDGVVDSADVTLAVNMMRGTAACKANIEGPATCTAVTVQAVADASRGRACLVHDSPSITRRPPAGGIRENAFSLQIAAGLQFYPVAPCRLVDTRSAVAEFDGIAPFSGPSLPPGQTLTIPVQSAIEASSNTQPAPCGAIPSIAQAYSFNLTIIPEAGGPVDYVSLWPAGSPQPFVATLNDPQGFTVANAAIVPAGIPSGAVSVYNAGPSATDVVIDMNGYFAAPVALQFYPVSPCRLVDTRGAAAGFDGIPPFAGPSITAAGTLTIPVQSATEASTNTEPAPCGAIPSIAQAYSFNLTVIPQAWGAVNYVSLWPAGLARPHVSTLNGQQGFTVANAAIVPAGTPSGGVSVYNDGPATMDVVIDMNGYFAAPAALQFYPVAPCRLVDTRGAAAGFDGIPPFSGPSITAGGTLTIPVQSSGEASANTEPAPCGVIPSIAQAYSLNLTVMPRAGGAVDYVSLWPAGLARPHVSTLSDPQGLIVTNAAIVSAGAPSGGVSVYNAGPSATDVIIDMNGYFAATAIADAPVITSATSASGTAGSPFSYQITATNTPASYNATGLPAGLSIDAATGLISGTPTSGGTSAVALGASNGSGTGGATLMVNIAHTVTLSWMASTSPDIAGYNIYRGTTSVSGPYGTMLNSVPIATLTYIDSSVVSGQVYYYVTTAVNTSGVESAYSSPATAVIP